MTAFYVPFSGDRPTPVLVNGHRMLILSHNQESLKFGLPYLGAERVVEIAVGDTEEEKSAFLNDLAQTVKGGIVIAPVDLPIEEVVQNLSSQLPWLH